MNDYYETLWKRLHRDHIHFNERYERWMASPAAFENDRDDVGALLFVRSPNKTPDDPYFTGSPMGGVAELQTAQLKSVWQQEVLPVPDSGDPEIYLVKGEKPFRVRWEMSRHATVLPPRDEP